MTGSRFDFENHAGYRAFRTQEAQIGEYRIFEGSFIHLPYTARPHAQNLEPLGRVLRHDSTKK